MKKIIWPLIVVFLIVALIFQECNNRQQSEFNEESYKDSLAQEKELRKVAYLKIDSIEAKNRVLEAKFVASEEKRAAVAPKWEKVVKSGKIKCDTTIINQLDTLHKDYVAACDSSVKNLSEQLSNEKEKSFQKDTVISSLNREIGLKDEKIDHQAKTIKKKERKWFWVKAGAVGVVIVAVVVKVSQTLKKE